MTVIAPPTVADDRATRQLAQREYSQPMVVEAGAGTGKTALLVARVVAWCMGEGWRRAAGADLAPEEVARRVIERVLAITFTDAAAAEMARKIAEAFAALAAGRDPVGWDPDLESMPEEPAVRAALLADEVHRLPVSTIHAFCQRLLSAHPLEAGLHPRFTVDPDEAMLDGLVVEVVEESLRGLEDDPAATDWDSLAAAGVDPQQIADAVRYLVVHGVGAADLELDPFNTERAAEFTMRLETALRGLEKAHGGRLTRMSKKSTNAIVARDAIEALTATLEGLTGAATWADLTRLAGLFNDTAMDRLGNWGKGKFNVTEAGCFEATASEVEAASAELSGILGALAPLRPVETAAARRVLGPLLSEVEARRSALGLVTYGDLLHRAARLLETSPGTVRELCSEVDQLLVDEFQDTDWVQCRLVESIAFGDGERPGLFVVGDPKQSIYAWRNADLAAYSSFVAAVRGNGGRVEPLVQNFRSVAPILTEVGLVVDRIMLEEEGVQPPFVELEPTGDRIHDPGFVRSGRAAVEYWVTWPATDGGGPPAPATSGDMTAFEAVRVASDIEFLGRREGVRWGDVAVLLRSTTAQEALLDAFRKLGVPFEVAREREFYSQREVVEAAALVRCVLDPTDLVALLTVLRSDVVGVPDVALAPLWDGGFAARMARLEGLEGEGVAELERCVDRAAARVPVSPTAAGLLPRWPVSVKRAVSVIAELREALATDTPDDFVERMRTRWMAEVSAAARFLGRFRRARLERFYADLERRMGDGSGVSGLTRFLRRVVEEGGEGGLGGEPDLQNDAVHVMTIHGAKGLDFEHVYVMQVHRESGRIETKTDPEALAVNDRWEYRLFGWPTPGFQRARDSKDRQTSAETVRLLYVAMTRAKERLVVSGGWKDGPAIDDPMRAKSFADLLSLRVSEGELAEQSAARVIRRPDDGGQAQWFMPANAELPGDSKRQEDDLGAMLPGTDRIIADREALSADRRMAAARMARPSTAGASARAHAGLAGDDEEEEYLTRAGSGGDGAAKAVGRVIHRMLEEVELDRELAPQLRDRLHRSLSGPAEMADQSTAGSAAERLTSMIDTFERGASLERLSAIAQLVVARELPIVAPPDPDDGPVGAVTGVADLVYRDPEDGRIVVADYKTDHLEDEKALADRAAFYEPQVRIYARALREALDLDHEPHVELWFLAADRIVRL